MVNSNASDMLDSKKPLMISSSMEATLIIVICQIKIEDFDILNKLCTLCVESKLTRVVNQNKSKTVISHKLEEIRANL